MAPKRHKDPPLAYFACEGGGGISATSLHVMGLHSCFLPAPNPQAHPEIHRTSTLGGLHPSLEGRGQVAASLGV